MCRKPSQPLQGGDNVVVALITNYDYTTLTQSYVRIPSLYQIVKMQLKTLKTKINLDERFDFSLIISMFDSK